MHTQQIPLNLLKISPRNVRKTYAGIESLAVSIASHSLIHNLVAEKVNGHYEVIAGGRRLLALQHLEKQKKLPEDLEQVRCLIIPAAGAGEVSLAENAFREPMHPADQFEAFQALLDTKMPEADVAARFSVTVQYLRQRMKLANVSSVVLKAYREGKLDLHAVEAYALSDDHAAQERVYKQGGKYAHSIRNSLTKGQIPATDKRVILIGIDVYEAAGGAVVRDIFDDRNEGYVADVRLLDKLVAAKIGERKEKLVKEGWSFVDVVDDQARHRYPSMQKAAKDIDKAKAGAIVYLDYNGKLQTERGVLKPGSKISAGGKVTAKKAKKPGELSFAQVQQLQAARDEIVADHLVKNPRIALAALAARMASRVLDMDGSDVDDLIRINTGHNYEDRRPSSIGRIGTDRSDGLEQEIEKLQALVPREVSLFQWLLTEPEARTHEILALCTAQSLMSVDLAAPGRNTGAEFAAIAGVDVAKHWKVTPEWLTQQPSAYLTAAILEMHGKSAAAATAKCKGKAGLVTYAFNMLEPRFDKTWLPAPLRPFEVKPAKTSVKKAAGKKVTAEPACRVCGCTDAQACEGGCHWVEPDLCSACAPKKTPARKKGA
jgi:ParB family transcriptional regulator, chromosome partitioning protein